MQNGGKQTCHIRGQALNLPDICKDLGSGTDSLVFVQPVQSAQR